MAKKADRISPYTGTSPAHRTAFRLLRWHLITSKENGNTIIAALVIVLVLISTGLMVANRSSFSLLGSIFSQDSKLAREAADIGIFRTLMQLNEPRNRQLLVTANDIDSISGDTAATSDQYQNKCPGTPEPDLTGGTSSGFQIKSASSSTYPTISIDDSSDTTGFQRKFRIISIRQSTDSTGNPLLPSLKDSKTGGIIITVEGQALKNGKVEATSTITREFEVIEKCCGLSLGGPSGAFGNDARKCDRNNPGFGLIAGAYLKNTGLFSTTGGSGITFRDENGNSLPAVYCLDNDPDRDCSDGGLNSGTGTQLVEVEPKLNDVPSIPAFPAGSTTCNNSSTDDCEIIIEADLTLSTADFANWGSASTQTTCTIATCSTSTTTLFLTDTVTITTGSTTVSNIRQCEGNNQPAGVGCKNKKDTYIGTPSTIVQPITTTSVTTVGSTISVTSIGYATSVLSANSEIAELKSHCFQQVESGVTVTYCSLDRLEVDNNKKLTFNTTGGPIRLYFPNPSDEDAPSIELKNGQSALLQTNSSKSPLSYADLVFYGISRANSPSKCDDDDDPCQVVQLGGGNADSTAFFSYFPSGRVTLQGTATMNGVVWANTIGATGSVNFVSSSSGVADVLDLVGMSDQQGGGGGSAVNLIGEYVTRLTRSFKFF